MHAVVVKVTVNSPEDIESSLTTLREEVVPGVSQAPGFVTGHWTLKDTSGMAMIIFESEDAATAASGRIPSTVPDTVTLDDVEVREVVAHA